MTKLLVVSDNGVQTGYGRIADETMTRLKRRGYDVMALSYAYDGLLPAQNDGEPLPYHVGTLQGKPNWPEMVANVAAVYQPDVIVSIQDAPYAQQIQAAIGDWSRYGYLIVTPVDGAPIYAPWLDVMRRADAGLTISQFGVDTFRKAGLAVSLCRPGVDGNKFYRLSDTERLALRQRAGIEPGAFVFGTMAQNQGRKSISLMLRAFFEFAQDKPSARYFMDMDPVSPAGWDIPVLCKQYGWDADKLIFRYQAMQAGVVELRERYNLLDAHAVVSHREGFGLPLIEAQACGVVGVAQDYCSGPEVVGGGNGILLRTIDYGIPGTWGGAEDRFVDMADFVHQLQWLHDNPLERAAMAQRGMVEARQHTWDAATDAMQNAVESIVAKRRLIPPATVPMHALPPVAQEVALVESIA